VEPATNNENGFNICNDCSEAEFHFGRYSLDDTQTLPHANAETRVEVYTRESDLSWAAAALVASREAVLNRWLDAAAEQPFHRGRRDGAVADNIPRLLDALVQQLHSATPRSIDASAPLESSLIQGAAQAHALDRTNQGLEPTEVLVEFRLLRQELGQALRQSVPDGAPTGDVMAAELFLNDALDGAIAVALSALTQRLEQLREEFLATTVHELGQPLTAARGRAQLMRRQLEGEPDLTRAQEGVKSILQATAQMQSLLANLAEASRTRLGDISLQREQTDLAQLIPMTIDQLGADARPRIHLDFAAGVPTTGEWDSASLSHVFANLLSNAAKYSAPDSPIFVTVAGDAANASIRVRDEGIGIPPDDIVNVFNRYGRGRTAIESHIDGLGLGLYLCRAIVEAHGGRIRLESPGENKGTVATVSLPRLPKRT
jgi:signal transduction histidine kinase